MSVAKETKQRARSPQETTSSRLRSIAICAVLVALIWTVFGQTVNHDFVNYDDKTYVYGNSLVSGGLNWDSLGKAFVDTRTNNWHPLTVISHMLDCQLFDMKPGGHHFTNVLLHTVAAILLFVWLRRITNSFWASAFVAALFAIHPLHVESVAWIAERKDVLSAVFFFLTLIAYLRYVRAPSLGRYVTMSILFVCGLMSKVMLATLPALLLLLDYWPLGRTHMSHIRYGWQNLIIEKIPLAALSLIAAIITFALQIHSPASVGQLPVSWRIENALVTYVTYIWQIFWPTDLAVFYPHPGDRLSFWQFGLAGALLIAASWLTFKLRRSRPYFFVGWFWYLIMLLPVIGIIEVGLQGYADRYTYLPHIGLYIAIAWAIADFSRSIPRSKTILAAAGAICVIALSACAYKQTTYWRNSETLWTRALAVTKNNDVAFTNLATFMMERGQLDDALSYFERALAIASTSQQYHYKMSLAVIHNSIGSLLARKGRLDQAIAHLRESVAARPDYADAHYNLGTLLFQTGDADGAITQWRTTLSIHPFDTAARTSLGNALMQKGSLREAADCYQKVLQVEPDSVFALNNLAWIMSAGPDDSLRNNELCLKLALRANELSNNRNPVFVRTLAAAYAQAGQFKEAAETAQRAAEIASRRDEQALVRQIMDDLDFYQRHQPLRDPALRNAQ